MPAPNIADKLAKKTLYAIGYDYLCDNFHKFKQSNKIKVSLAILNIFEKDDSKTRPNVIVMPVIQKSGEAPNVNINLEFNIGASHPSQDIGYPGEASRLN